MNPLVHLGIEYNDLGLRIAVLVDGRLTTIGLPFDFEQLILLDPYNSMTSLGVAFPSLFRLIGSAETAHVDHVVPQLLRIVRNAATKFGAQQFGRTVLAVPTGLMSMRRSILLASAKEAGLDDVELVDVTVPSAIVYSGGVDTPTTQLVYYLGYGECEYALVRVVRGRIKVIDSGIADSVSGQLFDLQLIEAIVLALREKGIFLGLKQFRDKQWLQFRALAGKVRTELAKKPVVELDLPASLIGNEVAIRLTLTAAGLAARVAPAVRSTIDDIGLLLERNDIKPTEIDAVVALGDTATRDPVTGLLAEAFPGKVLVGDIGVVAASSAIYSAALVRDPTAALAMGRAISHYLSPYRPGNGDGATPDAGNASIVTSITVTPRDKPTARLAAAAQPADAAKAADAGTPADGEDPADTGVEISSSLDRIGSAISAISAATASAPTTVAAAKDLIERGRFLIEEAAQMLQPLDSGQTAAVAEPNGGDVLMAQAESLLDRGLHVEAVSLAHRAYEEASLDSGIFARMLRVHLKAALALDQPDQYQASIQLLMCAHSHDQTDRSVHQALATRHFQHAQAMRDRGDDEAALTAVKTALRYDPKHAEAQSMFDLLSGSAANKAH